MKIQSAKLRAADEFRAKGDPRWYLNGIRINKDFIEATNGHVAIRMNSGVRTRADVIVRFKGKIPSSAYTTKLEFSKGKNTAYHYDTMGELVNVQIFYLEDGKYPDFKKIIPDDFNLGDFPDVQAKYLALIDKAFKKEKFVQVHRLHSESTKLVFGIKDKIGSLGNPLIIIMGCKK